MLLNLLGLKRLNLLRVFFFLKKKLKFCQSQPQLLIIFSYSFPQEISIYVRQLLDARSLI